MTDALAGQSRVTIVLTQAGDLVGFEVRDDGAGFDQAATVIGTGLQGIADRLAALGGTLRVRSAPGAGTTVTGRVTVRSRVAGLAG